jgi:acyl-CoA thioester hydrolase
MFIYQHKVHYYETDRMGVTHHSNYIRFMEEARVAFLDFIGASYARMEADGIISPVMAVEGRYLHSTTFDDVIDIEVFIRETSLLKLRIGYRMRVGETEVFEGTSLHCFLDKAGKAVRILDRYPQFAPQDSENE